MRRLPSMPHGKELRGQENQPLHPYLARLIWDFCDMYTPRRDVENKEDVVPYQPTASE